MFRETPGGLRYYVKRDGERVVSDRPTDGVKAMAIGIDRRSVLRVSAADLRYQLHRLQLRQPRYAAGDAVCRCAGGRQHPASAVRIEASSTRAWTSSPSRRHRASVCTRPDGEIESERVLTWPLSTGLNLGWRATPFQTLTLQYQLRFDGYVRDTTTSESFALPSSTVTNGIGVQWEFSRHGYSVMLNGTWFTRASWEPWGAEQADGGLLSTPRSYSKFTASVSRDFFIDALQKVHVNARLVRRARSRPLREIPVRPLRRDAHPRRPRRSAFRGAGDGARVLFHQCLRPVPPRCVPRSRVGTGRGR